MPTNTPNYNLTKPDVSGSGNAWGGLLNSDLDTLDTVIKTVETSAATAQAAANAAMPLAGGTFSGAVTFGTTGATTLPGGTTAQRPAGSAGQIRYNSQLGQFEGYTTSWGAIGGGAFSVGVSPPSNPVQGTPWWNSEDGSLYLYYDDGNSQQFVPAWGYSSAGVVGFSDVLSAEDNLLHNGDMRVWQRGMSFAGLTGTSWLKV